MPFFPLFNGEITAFKMLNLREKEVEIEIFKLASELKAKIDNALQKNETFKSQALNRVTLCMILSFRGVGYSRIRNISPSF